MRVPLSWLGEYVDIAGSAPKTIAARLTDAGLQVERVEQLGAEIDNVVVAEVQALEELTGFKKPIRWVTLTDGTDIRQVICGATNFAVGDRVAYARPPARLPGGMQIERRPAYGHESDGMICSARELGLGEDHAGILVLGPAAEATPLGADVVDALGLRDDVLELTVNPDRGYALSMRGVAREVATAFSVGFRDPADVSVTASAGGRAIRIDDPSGCDRYLLRTVNGLNPKAASPWWLQRRLTLAGMRPISLAVDVTNHVMLDVGQPLHGFDAASVTGTVVVRRAGPGERLRTLDGVERSLHADDLLITDDSGPIALAGVMGGAETEIGPETSAVLIEAAHFDPVSIAYTARRHRLASEASRRFERGVDDALPPAAAQLAAALLARLAGAGEDGPASEDDQRRPRPVITLAANLPRRLSGVDYPPERIAARLRDVGCELPDADSTGWRVTPPSWRPDLLRGVDLVEEVVRLEGYAGLPVTVPRAPGGRGLTREQRLLRQVGRAVAATGLVEVLTTPFLDERVADQLLLSADDPRRSSLRLANPVADDEPWLRASLLPGLLAALDRNLRRGFADVGLFETGPVFRDRPGRAPMPRLPAGRRPAPEQLAALDAALPDQPQQLAGVLAGRWERSGWWGEGRPATWSDAVQLARTAVTAVGIDLEVRASEQAPWHPGRCAELLVGGAPIGCAGELHPRVVQALGLPERSCAFELDLAPMLAAAPELVPAPTLSAYPAATLDLAVVVADTVPAADLTAALRSGAGKLLEDIRLFDVYRGDQVPAGSASYAFSLRLRALDRTLTAEEATAVRDRALAAAADQYAARMRAPEG